jgi:activator of HSP90 ATPase
MRKLKMLYYIHASKKEVWHALVNPTIIEAWGAGPAVMNEKTGTKFKLWGGDIFGENKEVIAEIKLVQEWFGGKWKEPSIVTFNLTEDNGLTTVELIHENIPDNEFESIKEGWDEYYMGPIKKYLEQKR